MSSTPPAAGHTVSSASSPERSESAAPDSDSLVTTDHPGIDKLLALLAYGEVAAFYRLTEEARMAPNLTGRINMASMAAAEMGHYDLLRDALRRRGVDVIPAMSRYASTLEDYHRLTTPSTRAAITRVWVSVKCTPLTNFWASHSPAMPTRVRRASLTRSMPLPPFAVPRV